MSITQQNPEIIATTAADNAEQFYNVSTVSEAQRLRLMALFADHVSVAAVHSALGENIEGKIILDEGCGDSTTLGEQLTAIGATYVPTDMREASVTAQRERGFNGHQSLVTALEVDTGSVDMPHARFTFGWLTSGQKDTALLEMLRVSRPDEAALTVIDYDWASITGPTPFLDVVEETKARMRSVGFEPDYGSTVVEDVQSRLEAIADKPGEISVQEHRVPTYVGPIDGALPILASTAESIASQLEGVGMVDAAANMRGLLDTLRQYVAQHPDEKVKLPDIVAAIAVIHNKSDVFGDALADHTTVYNFLRQCKQVLRAEAFIEGKDYEAVNSSVPGLKEVVLASHPSLVLAARRIQFDAYLKDGIVTNEAKGPDGALNTEIDPVELVQRSKYVVSLGETNVRSAVRAIYPSPEVTDPREALLTLPTPRRLQEHAPNTFAALSQHDLMSGKKKVIEVSALAKDMLNGEFVDVVNAVVGLADMLQKEGVDYAVMGLQESHLDLIQGVFGRKAIRNIDGDDAVHPVQLPGVAEAKKFVPLVVDVQKFREVVHAHANVMTIITSNGQSKLFAHLAEITAPVPEESL